VKQNEGPIEVSTNETLREALRRVLIPRNGVRHIIETGTYLGTGTTQVLIGAVEAAKRKGITLTTVESYRPCWEEACKTLSPWPWVYPRLGLTLKKTECLEWIKQDDVIRNHQQYPDIFIDNLIDPVGFYQTEIERSDCEDENVLEILVTQAEIEGGKILFCLDSCGGIGYLEFKKVTDLMRSAPYYLMMDDIQHIKHFRSLLHIQEYKGSWKVLYQDDRLILVQHLGD
jgi:hypothetical protein